MNRFLVVIIMGGMALALPTGSAQSIQLTNPRPDVKSDNPSDDLPTLPPAPLGKSTIFGGAIRNLDPVRDQFALQIYGQRAMKILFDARTQVYRDGVRIPLRDLRAENHASVQTTLDGTNVFALSIHILSQSPEGDCYGRVLRYDPEAGELTVRSAQSAKPVRLSVPANTSVEREGESAFTSGSSGLRDLVAGALVSVTFEPESGGRDVASSIAVLAVPGSSSILRGSIAFLDVPSGSLHLVDSQDGKSYQIHFDSARILGSRDLHLGEIVTVNAHYDGTQYQAADIAAN